MLRLVYALILLSTLQACRSIKPIAPSESELRIPQNYNNYSFTESIQHPVRTIRISIHVFQDSLGNGNFTQYDSLGNLAVDWYWLKGLVEDASLKMSLLQPMHMPSSSPYIGDSYIRYQVVGQYDWQDQSLFELNRVNPNTGDRMYQYIMSKENVLHKESSLHLFLAGGVNLDGGRVASRGIASGAPDKKWTVLFNYYKQAVTTKNYWPATLISHEIGHNLGLRHTWNLNDGCDDTPMNPYHADKSALGFQCWALNEPANKKCDEIEECSNNLMDYNAWQNALTVCQMAKIHQNINNNKGALKDIIVSDQLQNEIRCSEVQGPNVIQTEGKFEMQCTLGQSITWYVTPRAATNQSVGSGNMAHLKVAENFKGKASITFRAATEADIIENTKYFKVRSSEKTN